MKAMKTMKTMKTMKVMKQKLSTGSMTLFLSLLSSTILANESLNEGVQVQRITNASAQQSELVSEQTRIEQSKSWGLTLQEWDRYESLMKGQRGLWSPHLDPITALGVEARTEEERQKYARLLVDVEKQRVERELAFQNAYDQAWRDKYPELMPIDTFYSNDSARAESQFAAIESKITQSPVERISVVVTDPCESCDVMIQRLVSMNANMDIYVMDADDDSAIRRWAIRMNLPIDRVRSKNITLNHYAGEAIPSSELPYVVE